MKKLIVSIIFAASLVGCASVPMGNVRLDAALKTFTIAPDKAGVFIYRNELIGAGVKMDVELDGKPIGQTAAQTYLYKEVPPGMHTVTSKSENTDTLEINAKPGTLIYIWQEVKMGVLYARTKLHLVNDSEGKKGVFETELAETM